MQNIIIRVYYNQNVLSLIGGYEPGNFLEKVWEGFVRPIDIRPLEICRQVYEMLNGMAQEKGDFNRRSMSIGDVVELQYEDATSELYSVTISGWARIDGSKPPTFNQVLEQAGFRHAKPQRSHFTDAEWDLLFNRYNATGRKIGLIKEMRELGKTKHWNYGLKDTLDFASDWIYQYENQKSDDEDPKNTNCVRCGMLVCQCNTNLLTHLYESSNYSATLCGSVHQDERVQRGIVEVNCPECLKLRNEDIPF